MIVYFHRNPVTYEIFYVGVGTRKSRAYDFKAGRNPRYKNYINKYGLPVVQIVHTNLIKEHAHEWEKYYIELLKRKEFGGLLLNLTEGGDPTPIIPPASRLRCNEALRKWVRENPDKNSMKNPETVAKISGENNSSKRPEVREKLRLANLGKKASDETRLKQSLLKKGKPSNQPVGYKHSPETIERLRVINKEIVNRPEVKEKMRIASTGKKYAAVAVDRIDINTGKVLETYPSIADYLTSVGKRTNDGNITAVCRGRRRIAYGFKWAYSNVS